MKGTDWGRIVARLTAVLVFTRAFDYTYQVFSRYALEQEYPLGDSPMFDVVRIMIALALLILATALWLFSDMFAPKLQDENEVVTEPDKLIIALVAAFGAFIFLRYVSYSFNSGINHVFTDSFYFQQILNAQVFYGAAIALLGALMVVFARTVAGWLIR